MLQCSVSNSVCCSTIFLSYGLSLSFSFNITFFRSGRGNAHQGMDACVEEINADLKAWAAGDRDSNMWRRLVRNFQRLKKLRSKVSPVKNEPLFCYFVLPFYLLM